MLSRSSAVFPCRLRPLRENAVAHIEEGRPFRRGCSKHVAAVCDVEVVDQDVGCELCAEITSDNGPSAQARYSPARIVIQDACHEASEGKRRCRGNRRGGLSHLNRPRCPYRRRRADRQSVEVKPPRFGMRSRPIEIYFASIRAVSEVGFVRVIWSI